MIYTYNKEKLYFQRISKRTIGTLLLVFLSVTVLITMLSYKALPEKEYSTEYITEEGKVIILKEKEDSLTASKLKTYIYSLNLKYPEIVFAQAKAESAYFKSPVYLENHNLFGMKEASLRPNTAIGTNRNHAVYTDWRSSVIDYALYQAAYLKNVKTESEYYQYLGANYATDSNYVAVVKDLVAKERANPTPMEK